MSPRCEAILNGVACTDDAVAWLTIGCVHEHLDRCAICMCHLTEACIQNRLGWFWCIPCSRGEEPHDCRIHKLREERVREAGQ